MTWKRDQYWGGSDGTTLRDVWIDPNSGVEVNSQRISGYDPEGNAIFETIQNPGEYMSGLKNSMYVPARGWQNTQGPEGFPTQWHYLNHLMRQGIPIYEHGTIPGLLSTTQHDPSWWALQPYKGPSAKSEAEGGDPLPWVNHNGTLLKTFAQTAPFAAMGYGAGAAAGLWGESAAAGGTASGGATGGAASAGAGAETGALVGAGDMFGSGVLYESGAAGLGAAGGATAGVTASSLAQALAAPAAQQLLSDGADNTGAFDQYGSQSVPGDTASGDIFDYSSPTDSWWKNLLPQAANGAIDYSRLIGALGPALLGAYASNRQANSLQDLSNKYFEVGAPSRARYEASYAPGFSMENDPGYKDALDQTTKAFLHKASMQGNPAGNPSAWAQTLKDVNSTFAYPALQDYRRLNAGTGGLAALTSTAPRLDSAALDAKANVFNSIGYGVGNVFNPPTSLEELLRQMGRSKGPSLV